MTGQDKTVPEHTPTHEHMWTDSEPELFTKGLIRCRICELIVPRNQVEAGPWATA